MSKLWKKSSSNFKLDHSLDDVGRKQNYDDDSSVDSFAGAQPAKSPAVADVSSQIETADEKKARKRSHLVAYTTMFVMSIGFSIVLSGVWPYMKSIDGSLEKSALGWVVAANPLGQMLASPLLGLWGNKAGSIRGACIATILCFIGGNVMYAMLYAFQDAGNNFAYYMMIVARFIVGVSSANVTLCRSYLAGSTTLKERTTGIAVIAAAQALGFVVGPGIQAILTVVVKGTTGSGAFVWDKYTSAGWVAAVLGLINLVIIMPGIFQEHYIAAKEYKMMQDKNPNSMNVSLPKPNYLGIFATCFTFFTVIYMTSIRETIATPLVTDQYGIPDDKAVFSVSMALCAAGFMSVFIFIGTAKLSKVFDERKILIFCGMFPVIIGVFLHYPMGSVKIVMADCEVTTTDIEFTTMPTLYDPNIIHFNERNASMNYDSFVYSVGGRSDDVTTESPPEECYGCPVTQTWCYDVYQIQPVQLIIVFMISVMGYPVAMSLCQTVFSKMLGPKPQGLWMGLLTGCGSLARVTGPLWISVVYEKLGTIYTYMILGCLQTLSTSIMLLSYKNLVPMKVEQAHELRQRKTNGEPNA